MAELLGVSVGVVYADLKRLGLSPKWGDGGTRSNQARRRAEAAERVAEGSKRCPRCGVEKNMGEFAESGRSLDGRRSWCRSCCTANMRNRRQRKQAPEEAMVVEQPEQPPRQCLRCGELKPPGAYGVGPNGGAGTVCTQCRAAAVERQKARQRQPSVTTVAPAENTPGFAEWQAEQHRLALSFLKRPVPPLELWCCSGAGVNGSHDHDGACPARRVKAAG